VPTGPAPLAARIKAICETRYGYRRVDVLLRREGWHVNQKRIRRCVGPRQQIVDLALRVAGDDACDDVGDVGLRVDGVELDEVDDREIHDKYSKSGSSDIAAKMRHQKRLWFQGPTAAAAGLSPV
jgi:hypothetical protein